MLERYIVDNVINKKRHPIISIPELVWNRKRFNIFKKHIKLILE